MARRQKRYGLAKCLTYAFEWHQWNLARTMRQKEMKRLNKTQEYGGGLPLPQYGCHAIRVNLNGSSVPKSGKGECRWTDYQVGQLMLKARILMFWSKSTGACLPWRITMAEVIGNFKYGNCGKPS